MIDAADGRHRALDRRGQEAAHGLGAGPRVGGGDDDRGALQVGVLLHRQRRQGAQADEHDDQVDHHGEHRVPDEEIGDGTHGRYLLALAVGF
jgi:hypothetical protein